MLHPSYTRQFQKDVKRFKKRNKDIDKLKTIIKNLIHQKLLPESCRDHRLVGTYRDRRECHIEPDWLLIYKRTKEEIIFERTGTHSDLFK